MIVGNDQENDDSVVTAHVRSILLLSELYCILLFPFSLFSSSGKSFVVLLMLSVVFAKSI